jgi:hypothetical protein
MDRPAETGKGSCAFDTARYQEQWVFMKGCFMADAKMRRLSRQLPTSGISAANPSLRAG